MYKIDIEIDEVTGSAEVIVVRKCPVGSGRETRDLKPLAHYRTQKTDDNYIVIGRDYPSEKEKQLASFPLTKKGQKAARHFCEERAEERAENLFESRGGVLGGEPIGLEKKIKNGEKS